MKTRAIAMVIMAGVVMLDGCHITNLQPSAQIYSISPIHGPVGTVVTILGTGFSGTVQVFFSGVEASILDASSGRITAVAPGQSQTGPVTVASNGTIIIGPTFTYDPPSITDTYYFSFTAGSTQEVFQVSNKFYQGCGNCACTNIPPTTSDNASLSFCNDVTTSITGTDINAWNGKTFTFGAATFPTITFAFTINETSYSTDNVADQTGSTISITKIEADGTALGGTKNTYKVTGTFTCKVATANGNSIAIDDGKFVVDFSEQ